ncbi:hypothetical protein SteCoe_12849 [Stentor coeruleus]|uniref:Peptidase C1A papain C-terminal domain-containing protein n=1 Tax=Stentor coeruleus TaxID=5963 RepID=A0A1R2C9U2_9CILI|nr:hypothetical protein SteCoe_12849 [Stentor coeruleus]
MEGLLFEPVAKIRSRKTTIAYIVGGLALVGLICGVASMTSKPSLVYSSNFLELQEFDQFIRAHGKIYKSQAEFDYRLKVYQDNLSLIRMHNSIDEHLVLKANKFADLTNEEFKALYTSEIPHNLESSQSTYQDLNASPPLSIDWRDKGAVTDVQNQGINCKASWAFSGVGAMESAWNIAGNDLEDLSVQQVIDCISQTGCQGSTASAAMNYALANNLTTDLIYPYYGTNMTCNTNAVKQYAASFTNVTQVPTRNPQALTIAISGQPVAAAVESDQFVWQFYYSGVITEYCGININHYVLIVGYNIDPSLTNSPYYTCKNSWGGDWGESGYVRISTGGQGNGICGIAIQDYYATAAKAI